MGVDELIDEETLTICVLGDFGVGKGSTLNTLFQVRTNDLFHARLLPARAPQPMRHVCPWRGHGENVQGIDIPAHSDSFGRDSGYVHEVVKYLKYHVRYVHCFLVLFHGQDPRIGQHLRDTLLALRDAFGIAFLDNVLIGFTHWVYDGCTTVFRDRRLTGRSALHSAVNQALQWLLGHDHDCKAVFLDNMLNMTPEKESHMIYGHKLPLVKNMLENEIAAIYDFMRCTPSFHCEDIRMAEHEKVFVDLGNGAYDKLIKVWTAELGHLEDPANLSHRLETDIRRELDALHAALDAEMKLEENSDILAEVELLVPHVIDKFKKRISEMKKYMFEENDRRMLLAVAEAREKMIMLGKEAYSRLSTRWRLARSDTKDPEVLSNELAADMQEELDALFPRLQEIPGQGLEWTRANVVKEFKASVASVIESLLAENEVRLLAIEKERLQSLDGAVGVMAEIAKKACEKLVKKWDIEHPGIEDHEGLLDQLEGEKEDAVNAMTELLTEKAALSELDLDAMVDSAVEEFDEDVQAAMVTMIEQHGLKVRSVMSAVLGKPGMTRRKSEPAVVAFAQTNPDSPSRSSRRMSLGSLPTSATVIEKKSSSTGTADDFGVTSKDLVGFLDGVKAALGPADPKKVTKGELPKSRRKSEPAVSRSAAYKQTGAQGRVRTASDSSSAGRVRTASDMSEKTESALPMRRKSVHFG